MQSIPEKEKTVLRLTLPERGPRHRYAVMHDTQYATSSDSLSDEESLLDYDERFGE